MSEDLNAIQRAKAEIDGLVVQLSLGKSEAIEFIEGQKKTFTELVKDTEGRITLSDLVDNEKTATIRQKLDQLRLQLALGKMESRDTYVDQRDRINSAIDSVSGDLEPLKESASEVLTEVLGGFQNGADSFKTKLNALALNLGLGMVVAEDEAKLHKDRLQGELAEVQANLKPSLDEAARRAQEAGAEAKTALDGIRENLKTLLLP